MDLYRLDSSFRRVAPVEDYDSFIWTERYSDAGELVLRMADTPKNRIEIPEGTFISLTASREVMLIESRSVEDGILQFSGPSLAGFLRNRFARKSWNNKYGEIDLSDYRPGVMPLLLVQNYATSASTDLHSNVPTGHLEAIPNLSLGPEDTTYSEPVDFSIPQGNLYDAVKTICDNFGFGFTLYLDEATDDSYELVFLVYMGKHRTVNQSVNPVVQFSSALDSLVDIKELRSIAGYKNVAYAFAPNIISETQFVGYAYANPDAVSAIGFERRTLLVLADDIQPDDVSLGSDAGRAGFVRKLNARARNGLINNNYIKMVDGQIVPQSQYQYGIDYFLGDTIDLLAAGGAEHSQAMVTEYIYSKDANGFASYPTLTAL